TLARGLIPPRQQQRMRVTACEDLCVQDLGLRSRELLQQQGSGGRQWRWRAASGAVSTCDLSSPAACTAEPRQPPDHGKALGAEPAVAAAQRLAVSGRRHETVFDSSGLENICNSANMTFG
ncbi:hypothetical protein COCSUDRAFT_33614, partial [Coccomyxa subellipsoidea C-169]